MTLRLRSGPAALGGPVRTRNTRLSLTGPGPGFMAVLAYLGS
jgi:hypothetical protein